MDERADMPAARYAALADRFLREYGTIQSGCGFGATSLKARGTIFAMLVHDRLVVKLPRTRVEALIASGAGARFAPGPGRPMKEWLMLDVGSTIAWDDLARDAHAFVTGGYPPGEQ